jgi:ribosomal protein L25 (general stress protein Ctc)
LCSSENAKRIHEAIRDGLPGLRPIGSFGDDELYEVEESVPGKGSVVEDVTFRVHIPERVGKDQRVTASIGMTNHGEFPFILFPPVKSNLHLAIESLETSTILREEEFTATHPQILNEGEEALVPFWFYSPRREGRYRIAVTFEDPISGREIKLKGESVSVEAAIPERRRGPIDALRHFLEYIRVRPMYY